MTTTTIPTKFAPANENASAKTVDGDVSVTVDAYSVTTVASVSKPWRRVTISYTGRVGESGLVAHTNTRSRSFKTMNGAMRFARSVAVAS